MKVENICFIESLKQTLGDLPVGYSVDESVDKKIIVL